MRRAGTFLVVAVGTAIAALWWLHEGDLGKAVKPVSAQWDAELLLRDAGIPSPEAPPVEPVEPAPEPGAPEAPAAD